MKMEQTRSVHCDAKTNDMVDVDRAQVKKLEDTLAKENDAWLVVIGCRLASDPGGVLNPVRE